MAMIFPTTPAIGDTTYVAGTRYYWDGVAWTCGNPTNATGSRRTKPFVATSGQTDFVTSFNLDNCEVIMNGVQLFHNEYTVSDGTVTLNTAADLNDEITIVAYGTSDYTNGPSTIYSLITESTDEVSLGLVSANAARTLRVQIQASDLTAGEYHSTNLYLVHDGADVHLSEFGSVYTGTGVLATYSADIDSDYYLNIYAIPSSINMTEFKMSLEEIGV